MPEKTSIASTPYFEVVVQALRASDLMARHGFPPDQIHWWKKGANHFDLMVITKAAWTLGCQCGSMAGYTGINVHLECERPGVIQVHCELIPRQGSEAKADQTVIVGLLRLKGRITLAMRDRIERFRLGQLGVTLRHTRKDPSAPSSLKVMGFETGLSPDHSPKQFVIAIEKIISVMTGLIEEVMTEMASAPELLAPPE